MLIPPYCNGLTSPASLSKQFLSHWVLITGLYVWESVDNEKLSGAHFQECIEACVVFERLTEAYARHPGKARGREDPGSGWCHAQSHTQNSSATETGR